MNINWDMAFIAVILFGIAWSLHHFKGSIKFGRLIGKLGPGEKGGPGSSQIRSLYERGLAALVMLGSGTAVIAAAGMLGPVWAWAQANVLALLGVGILLAIWVYHMVVRGNRHHVTRTTAIAAMFGMVMALIWGGWTGIAPATGKALRAVAAAAGHAASGNAADGLAGGGHAAASASGSGHLAAIVLCAVVGVLLLTVIGSYRKERRQKRPGKPGRSGRAMGGGPGGALPAGDYE